MLEVVLEQLLVVKRGSYSNMAQTREPLLELGARTGPTG